MSSAGTPAAGTNSGVSSHEAAEHRMQPFSQQNTSSGHEPGVGNPTSYAQNGHTLGGGDTSQRYDVPYPPSPREPRQGGYGGSYESGLRNVYGTGNDSV